MQVRIIKISSDFFNPKFWNRLLLSTTFIGTKKHPFYNSSQV